MDARGYLSKREQQIMEALFESDGLSANDLSARLPGAPSNATVRTLLRILEAKGHIGHREEAGRFVYFPTESRQSAARQALRRLVDTFFRGSVGDVVATLLRDERLEEAELARLQALVDEAKRGR